MKMSSVLQKIILLSASLVVAFLLAELILRFFVPVRAIGPSFTSYDSVYGKRLKKNFWGMRITPEFTMLFSTNSLGFRGPEPEFFPEQPILFLGDSFTMGYGVNDGDEFPELVRKKMMQRDGRAAAPVINAGMGDNGQGWWLKFLRREGKIYKPLHVVLQISANDFEDNVKESLFKLSDTGELKELQIPPVSLSRSVQNLIDAIPGLSYSYIIGLGNQVRWFYARKHLSSIEHTEKQTSSTDNLTLHLLDAVIRICEQEDWPVMAIVIGVEGSRLQLLEACFKQHNIKVIHTPDKKIRPDLYYKNDGHWNKQGHELAAEMILEKLGNSDFSSR